MKSSRQEKILELIEEREISTQEELTSLLNDLGYKTTQATVSRDIKALHLKKVPSGKSQKYVSRDEKTDSRNKSLRLLSNGVAGLDQAGNLTVIKTIPGMAMAVAAALDDLKLEEIVGSIAGDDTIMCACRTNADAEALITRIRILLKDM